MTIKKGNKTVPVTLTAYHLRKLAIIKERTGLSNTGVIQRLLENHDVFGYEMEDSEKEPST